MSKFRDAFKKQAEKFWDDAREAEQGDVGGVRLPEGSYEGVLTFEGEAPTKGALKGVPIVKETITVDVGEYTGRSVDTRMVLGGDYATRAFEKLAKHLKKAFPDEADDIAAFDADGIVDYVEQLMESDDEVRVSFDVVTTELEEDGKKKEIKYFSIVGPCEGDAPKAKPAKAKAEEDEEDEEPAPKAKAKAKPKAKAKAAADEEHTFAKGDTVFYTPEDEESAQEYVVSLVFSDGEHARIVDAEGNRLKVKLADLQPE